MSNANQQQTPTNDEVAQLRQRIAELEQTLAQREQEKEVIQQSETKLRTIIENMPVMVDAIDYEGNIVLWNKECERVIGFTADEIVNNPNALAMLYPDPDYLQYLFQRWAEVGNNYRDFEWDIACKDGLIRSISWSNISEEFPIPEWRTWAIGIDVTEQRRAEEKLRMFSVLAENAPDAIAVARIDTRTFLYANPSFRQLYGYDETVIAQLALHDICAEENHQVETIVQHIIEHGSWQGTIQHRSKDGSTFPVQMSGIALENTAGTQESLAFIIRDISVQIRAAEERAALQEQIIEAQRASLRELSTPLIPVSKNVVIMPLIGTVDSTRAQLVMETLLEGVAERQAELAIVDITGVAVVDTQVANALVQAAQAVKLLGAQVMLTGIQPNIAQTLVSLGVDLTGIITRSNLQSGIAFALDNKPA
jgi:rsbT co-antagonist protein RsbR